MTVYVISRRSLYQPRRECERSIVISGGSRICEKGGPGIQIPRQAWKSRSVGGLRHIFSRNFFCRHLHYWVPRGTVRLPDRPPGWQAKKKKKKKSPEKNKNKNRPKEGGAAADSPPPPPWIRHWLLYTILRQALFCYQKFLICSLFPLINGKCLKRYLKWWSELTLVPKRFKFA